MDNRDRFYFSKSYKEFNKNLGDGFYNNPIGLKDISKLELFKIAVSYGLDDPKEFTTAKEGLCLSKDLKSTKDISLFNTILLGTATSNDEIDACASIEKNFDQSELCANSGFEKIIKLIEENKDEELLQKKMFNYLDTLYQKNVKLL